MTKPDCISGVFLPVQTLLRGILIMLLGGSLAWAQIPAQTPAPVANALTGYLDGLSVDKLWLAGHSVDWRTGAALARTGSTHCSAFAGAVTERLDIELLRPPEHGQTLLANAQYDWLATKGSSYGWHAVENGQAAQAEANLGHLVLAVVKNKNPRKPGHIAIVRPGVKTPAEIAAEGPEVIQAGRNNYIATSLKQGFAEHPGAFASGAIKFFAHAIDPAKLTQPPK